MKAPATKLGTIESQLKAVVALFEFRFTSTPLRKQCGENERVDCHHCDGHLGTFHALYDRHGRITKAPQAEGYRADYRDRRNECARDREGRLAAYCQP